MAFTATPTDGSGVPIPMSSAVPDGTNTPLAIEGGPSIATGGNTLVPVSMYVKDGNDIAQGFSTDAANANSVIGQLKQLKTNTTLGQAVMAASLPVTMASNQSAVPTIEPCIVSTLNSSVATLTATSAFTGSSESSLNFSALAVEVFANVASAVGGLSVQQSQDGANWDVADTFSVLASTSFNTTVNLVGQFFRVVYTNGATGQATFRLQTIKQPVDVVLPRTLTTLGNLKTSLQEVNGSALALGQTTMVASLPVTLASNQSTVSVSQLAAGSVSGTLQTAQAGNAAGSTLAVLGMSASIFTVSMAGFTGTVSFEGSEDGTNYQALAMTQLGTTTILTTVTGATTTSIVLYECSVAGLQLIRARTSGVTAGTVTVTAHAVPVIFATKTVSANQAGTWTVQPGNTPNTTPWLGSIHDGTNKANVLSATNVSNAVGSQAALLTSGSFAEQASLTAGSLNADLVPATDVSNYKWISLQITGTFNGTISFQACNDNINWQPCQAWNINSSVGVVTNAGGGNLSVYALPCGFRYFRARMTAYTSGTATGTAEFYTSPSQVMVAGVQAQQFGNWTVQLNNGDQALVNSAAYTTTQTAADQTNTAARGIRVVLDMTVVGTGSVTLEIDAKDTTSGKYYAMLTGVAVTTNTTNVYTVYPGLTPAANLIASDVLPKTWRVKVTANNANSATYSVGSSYLL